MLHIDTEHEPGSTLVRVAGEVDMATAPTLRDHLTQLAGVVVVDLSEVTFLDSSGLSALVSAKKHLVPLGGALRVRGAQPNVRVVFEVSGLDDWFDVDTSVDGAAPEPS